MSMLSKQCNKLRKLASEIQALQTANSNWLWKDGAKLVDAVNALREAADTIEGLRDRLQADALGSGTCDDLGGTGGYTCSQFACSKCGCTIEITDYQFNEPTMYTADGIADVPHFCPGCGARIRKAVSK